MPEMQRLLVWNGKTASMMVKYNVFYATQYGHFHLDSGAWLVDSNGFRVQGFSDEFGSESILHKELSNQQYSILGPYQTR
jgi:hypothetical protein